LRIAIISDVFYPNIGGAEKRFFEISKRLAINHEIHVFTMQIKNTKKDEYIHNIKIHRFHKINSLYVKGRRKIKPAIIFSIILFFKLIFKKFDLIECNSFPYFPCITTKFISIIKRCPIIITFHEAWGSYWYSYLKYFGIFGRIIELLVARLSNNLIAVSEFTKSLLIRNLKLNPKKIIVIPNGIDLNLIKSIETKKDPNKIIYVGRLNPEKKVDLLIRAFKYALQEYPQIKLFILGEGPELINLKNLVKRLKLNSHVEFLNFLESYEDVLKFIKTCKIIINPSKREGQSIVCLESMALKTPVISVNYSNNALSYIIENNINGILCSPTPKCLGDGIIQLLSNYSLYSSIQKVAYQYSKKYDWNLISKRIEKYYKKVYINKKFFHSF